MVLGAYLCCAIAGLSRRAALFGVISLGLVIGRLSMPSSWHREPHWYRIILFLEWAPCVWNRMEAQVSARHRRRASQFRSLGSV
jgi:hypothetical protein